MKYSQQNMTKKKKGKGLKGGQETPRLVGKIAAIALDEIRGNGRMFEYGVDTTAWGDGMILSTSLSMTS